MWWMWVLAGIGLLAFEVATPGGFFALFFGVGALLTAIVSALGFGPAVQWFSFSALSIVGLVTLRGPMMRRLSRRPPEPVELVGEQAVLLADLPPGGEAKAELRGSPWTARSSAAVTLKAGQRCEVERVDGLTLWLRAS